MSGADATTATDGASEAPTALDVVTYTDGGQTGEAVAERLAGFLSGATSSLDIAVYDFALSPSLMTVVGGAITQAAGRGVQVRLALNADAWVGRNNGPDARGQGANALTARPNDGDEAGGLGDGQPRIPVPPPCRTAPAALSSLGVPIRSIPGMPDLMHHKYVVRDRATVWTGSLNWTDDAWTREENLIAVVRSDGVAAAFERDFDEIWTKGIVQGTGDWDPPPATVGDVMVRTWFSPGRGRRLAHRIATAIGRAVRRVRVASPVLTAGPILGTLADVAAEGRIDLAGVLDATQMHEVLGQWRGNRAVSWKPVALHSLLSRAPFSGKVSTPWRPDATHDYMHAKVTVADDIVFLGSYNLSGSGEDNAENVLEITDPALAERMAGYIDDLRGRYPRLTL
jgi:phosphatidylserine/phosphatidylglycerophosphate/cardiolipin synthase-like enzyme